MINVQLLDGVLIALAILLGIAIALSLTMMAAASVAKPGQAPPGGIKRDLPQQPQPDTDDAHEDDARELVLL